MIRFLKSKYNGYRTHGYEMLKQTAHNKTLTRSNFIIFHILRLKKWILLIGHMFFWKKKSSESSECFSNTLKHSLDSLDFFCENCNFWNYKIAVFAYSFHRSDWYLEKKRKNLNLILFQYFLLWRLRDDVKIILWTKM